jgi:hypothetical protein
MVEYRVLVLGEDFARSGSVLSVARSGRPNEVFVPGLGVWDYSLLHSRRGALRRASAWPRLVPGDGRAWLGRARPDPVSPAPMPAAPPVGASAAPSDSAPDGRDPLESFESDSVAYGDPFAVSFDCAF